jgi:hypothetical protein
MPPDMLLKEMFAEAYGWSEADVDNASLDALTWYPLIRESRAHAIEVEQKRQARENRSGR